MKLSESDMERTCSDWLALDGWRSLKTDPCSDRARGKGFGEKGMADRLYLRYWASKRTPQPHDQRVNAGHLASGNEIAWIEWKAKRGKPSQKQLDWHRDERARGALTLIAGVDFPRSIEGFQEWYRTSGLMRRKI